VSREPTFQLGRAGAFPEWAASPGAPARWHSPPFLFGRLATTAARAILLLIDFVSNFDDEDDWVGTPPEGRYSRDRAKPEFWRNQRPVSFAAAGLALVVLVVIVIALLR
jgi:hypothetical protein